MTQTGHSPSIYSLIAGDGSPFNNQIILLLSDDASSIVPMVFNPANSFSRLNSNDHLATANIQGVLRHLQC